MSWSGDTIANVAHLGDDVMVLCIEGCAFIVGFRELVHKLVKIAKVNTGSGERGCLGEKDPTDIRGIPSNSNNFDLGDFIHLCHSFVSKLISNGEVTTASPSLSQSIQYGITITRNQTTLN